MDQTQRRTILITGANKGIGYVTVARFLSEPTPYDIILTSRDVKLGEKAIATLESQHPKSTSTLTYHQLDVNDDRSVENLVNWVKDSNRKIDVLVNNAGIGFADPTEEQTKLMIKTNFFSVINLTEKIIPFLSDDAKVLQISSVAGTLAFHGETLRNALSDSNLTEPKLHEIANHIAEWTRDFKPIGPINVPIYASSKALLNAYVRYFLPSKVKSTQQVYSVHPGWVKSDLGGENAPGELEEGADTIVYLAGLPFKFNPELNARMIGDRKVMDF